MGAITTDRHKSKPYCMDLEINGKHITMELVPPECTLQEQWPDLQLSPSKVQLHSYPGESIPALGTVDVLVNYADQEATLVYPC